MVVERDEVRGIMESRKLLTMDEAAERLNVKRRYIKHLIEGQRIDIIKIGRLVRIPETTIEELIAVGYKQASSE